MLIPYKPNLFTPIIKGNTSIAKTELFVEHRFDEGSGQVLNDYSGNGNNGQLGSTTGNDSNDPHWNLRGLSFLDDDFIIMAAAIRDVVKKNLPYTIEIAAKFNSLKPGSQTLFSSTVSSVDRMGVTTGSTSYPDAILKAGHYNGVIYKCKNSCPIVGEEPFYISFSYNELLSTMHKNSLVQEGTKNPPTTTNVRTVLGANVGLFNFFNGEIYYFLLYSRFLTQVEKYRNYQAVKTILKQRGVLLP